MLKKNPRFTVLALLVLTIAIGAGALAFRVLTLHPHANSVDLGSLKERLRTGEIPNLHSVLLIQHDQMIAEWYFEGADEERGRGRLGTVKFGPETLHDVRSRTMSIVSLLFGIAMADGAIRSLDSPVLDYFPLLHEGRDARGHQIVPKSWIRESTAPHVTTVEDVSCKIRYGYFWWVGPGCEGSSYCALGNGGQSIWVAPSRDIVIVTTAGLYDSPVQKRVMDVWSAVVDASKAVRASLRQQHRHNYGHIKISNAT